MAEVVTLVTGTVAPDRVGEVQKHNEEGVAGGPPTATFFEVLVRTGPGDQA